MSPQELARIAGSLYLIIILAGLFIFGFVPATIFASFLSPDFAAHLVPYIQLPSLVGEGSLCLTLLAGAINVPRWMEQAA